MPLSSRTTLNAEWYSLKPLSYFSCTRTSFIRSLPRNASARILEIGCGAGGSGALALADGRCSYYCGIEVCPIAAEEARERLTEVLVGNIEELDLPWVSGSFDVLILGDVLEHLLDPAKTLRKLRRVMKSGSLVLASSPNVAHHRIISMLLRGKWALTDSGPMDRTHLRWFTPSTFKELFESTGYCVDGVREMSPLGKKSQFGNLVTFGTLKHIFIRQMELTAHCD